LIDDSNSAIISNITRVVMGKFFTPTIADASGYILNFNNSFYNPHARHNADAGGVVASTGFKVSGDTINEMFFDDDGNGNLRRFFISAGVKTYVDLSAGTVDYTNGVITLKSINIISVSNVDNATSTEIRVTAIPDSSDIIPVRNQLLEIDLVNTVVNVTIDTLSVGDPNSVSTGDLATSSYTTTTSGY